jgi:hypothetical protein
VANELTNDPLVIDTTETGIPLKRIQSVAFDASGTGTVSITGAGGRRIFSTDVSGYFEIGVLVPEEEVDVTISSGILYIYLGAGPR